MTIRNKIITELPVSISDHRKAVSLERLPLFLRRERTETGRLILRQEVGQEITQIVGERSAEGIFHVYDHGLLGTCKNIGRVKIPVDETFTL